MEVLVVDALSADAFQVVHVVQPQQRTVSQAVLPLQNVQRISSDSKGHLEPSHCGHVFRALAQVVEQTDHLLAVDCRLYCLVSSVQSVGAEPKVLRTPKLTWPSRDGT